MKNILVISPHPDDEAIGCGGTIASHVAEGDRVEVIFLTSGEKGGHGMSEERTIQTREKESAKAALILGLHNISFWREPDGNLAANGNNIKRLIQHITKLNPAVIYAPHEMEAHPDHQAAALLVKKALKKLPADLASPTVLLYEVWTPLQILDHIVDISTFVGIKRKAITAYRSQCKVLAFDKAILGLNRYRGEMHSWPGGDHAEVFKKPSS